jgi:hypothetical protein
VREKKENERIEGIEEIIKRKKKNKRKQQHFLCKNKKAINTHLFSLPPLLGQFQLLLVSHSHSRRSLLILKFIFEFF